MRDEAWLEAHRSPDIVIARARRIKRMSGHAYRPAGIRRSPEHIGNRRRDAAPIRLENGGDPRDALHPRAFPVILSRMVRQHVLAQRFGEFGQKVERRVSHENT